MVIILGLIVSITLGSLYYLTSGGNTVYNHYTLLADAFLHGKLYVEGIMPWLEKVPIDDTRFYVVNPPLPAILALPAVAIFGKEFPQQYLAHVVGACIILVWYLLTYKLTHNKTKSFYIACLVGIGNIIWFLAAVGSIWYLAQLVGVLFLSLALLELQTKNRPLIIGFLIALACLARIQLLLALPFFMLLQFKNIQYLVKLALGIIPFGLIYAFYNYLRFGDILQAGYTLIPGITQESWFAKGPFHYSYIPRHLKIIFTSLPTGLIKFPFLKPEQFGYAIWFTSPVFGYALLNKINKTIIASWVGILGIALINFLYGSVGISQFGYRYAVDFYPFIFFLVAYSLKIKNLTWHHWLLLVVSISINTWGVIWLNKSDWLATLNLPGLF